MLEPRVTEKGPKRLSCRHCGTRLANERPEIGFIAMHHSLFQAPVPAEYAPVMHIFYRERVVDVKDNLPKYMGAPPAFGGTDEMYTE